MAELKKNAELIFIPSPGIGHIVPFLEFAKLLINQAYDLSIKVLCINSQLTPLSDPYITSMLASMPQIQLIHLPHVEPPPQELLLKSFARGMYTFMETLKPHVKTTMQCILSSYTNSESNHACVGLVLDLFCLSLVDVGNELGIPSYLFMTSNVGVLGLVLSLEKHLHHPIEDMFNESDPDLSIPGFNNLVPFSVLPDAIFRRDGAGSAALYKLAQRSRDTKGIIFNTFSELEKHAIDALSGQSPSQTPPICAVGPLINLKSQPNPKLDQAQHDKILKWLDEQPPCSVVFLCFGSRGSFDPSQTRERALALWHSGVRFLWAMRSTTTSQPNFPEGFLEWMEGKGMICEWAPQAEVLAHKATGGFVSHCGWNSILDSLWFGVTILTWPIYAEQQLNAFTMVRELGLSVELRLDYRRDSDVVLAEEIEKGLKHLMNRDNVVHKKVQEMKEMARTAVLKGGSSFTSVQQLLQNIMCENFNIG